MSKREIVEFSLEKLKEICKELGWVVSFNEDNEFVQGMVIGTESYVDNIIEGYEDFQEYVVMAPDSQDDNLH